MTLNKLIERLKTTDRNLILMVGVPLSGKSTLIKKLAEHVDIIISRDEIILEKADGLGYSDAFHKVDQKAVSTILKYRIMDAAKTGGNVVIDMMNHRPKLRRAHLSKFDKYTKIALITDCPSLKVLLERNDNRNTEESKFIPIKVIEDTLKMYSSPTKEEGFDYIVYDKYNKKGVN
jgi:predicted kinase